MEPVLNINSLPYEILLKIFSYLTLNELGRISRVCRTWNECIRSPVLWKEVEVKILCRRGCKDDIVSNIVKKLSFSTTHLKLDFSAYDYCDELNFEDFFEKLNGKCPNLYVLILHDAQFSVSLPSIINLCSDYLPNLKVLMLPGSVFGDECKEKKYAGRSQVQSFDISLCYHLESSDMEAIFTMPCLKKLSLFKCLNRMRFKKHRIDVSWFEHDLGTSCLQRLEYLNLGQTGIDSSIFRILQDKSRNLTELFLCGIDLCDNDITFNNDVFPHLKTICLKDCFSIHGEGIASLVQSCQSIENVYIRSYLTQSHVKKILIESDNSKLTVCKVIADCEQHNKLRYSFD